MDVTTAVMLIAAAAVGAAIGWLAHAYRSGAELARARAELSAIRQHQEVVAQALGTASEDAARRQSGAIGAQVAGIVGPLRETLDRMSQELARTERNRAAAYAGLTEQVSHMNATSRQLGSQTQQLASALRTPQLRGRWGELHLERVVELAGLSRHCDFSTQVDRSTEQTGDIRPDLVVHLPGDRHIVVDAKAPLQAYLEATTGDDGPRRDDTMREHARQVRSHIQKLSAKKYWAAFDAAPEFVVLFLPADPILEAACRADDDLLDYALRHNVIVATPTSLVGLLRAAALGWRQESLARDAQRIHELGRELYRRIGTVDRHLDKLGTALTRSVDAFNATVGAMETRVGVTARRLAELDAFAGTENGQDSPSEITHRPREIRNDNISALP
ncbi:DNA recombination protein RmuC [Jongsikchunia kroppenstedtii]|uniref:DNA recombination protein RmuC n=1 Tax=Jongsikchunia kroppenstedtii TaxID=1121721 RepID=UPI00037822FF|nr:DNA recombination protein RmuC [Jongsikchunia kroppenstedtii]